MIHDSEMCIIHVNDATYNCMQVNIGKIMAEMDDKNIL